MLLTSCAPNNLASRLAQHTFRGWIDLKIPQVDRLTGFIYNDLLNNKCFTHILKKPPIAFFT